MVLGNDRWRLGELLLSLSCDALQHGRKDCQCIRHAAAVLAAVCWRPENGPIENCIMTGFAIADLSQCLPVVSIRRCGYTAADHRPTHHNATQPAASLDEHIWSLTLSQSRSDIYAPPALAKYLLSIA